MDILGTTKRALRRTAWSGYDLFWSQLLPIATDRNLLGNIHKVPSAIEFSSSLRAAAKKVLRTPVQEVHVAALHAATQQHPISVLDIGSVSIELSRGPCYGSCPSYSLTLHGDGLVEYRGIRFVRVKEKQTAKSSGEQIVQVLRDLDRMDFFGVEDRAFQWCFDTTSTSIFVSVDGRQKRVTTDTCGVGLKGGPKARFLQIADEIDAIAGSKQWVQCNGWSCRN